MAELAAAYLPTLAVVPAAAVCGCMAALYLWRGFKRKKMAYLPVLAGVLFGLAWNAGYTRAVVAPLLRCDGQTVQCTVTAETDCEASYVQGLTRGTLRVEAVDGIPADFTVYGGTLPFCEPGDRFTATLSLAALKNDAYKLSRYAKGTYLQAEYEGGYQLLGSSGAPRFTLYRLRQSLSRAVRTYLPTELGGLEAAMLLADRSALTETIEDQFRAAGVSHLLAVSGMHVALLCGIFFGDEEQRRKRRFLRPAIAGQMLLVLFYMALTGFPLSVVRAGVVFLAAELGYLFLQPPDTLTSLAFCAAALSLQNAYLPCDIGFQLSVCAVLGVMLAASLANWERRRFALDREAAEDLPEKAENPPKGAAEETTRDAVKDAALHAGFWLLCTVQTAAFASLATLPVLIAHRMTASGVGVLTNLLVTWALAPAIALGLLLIVPSLMPFLAPAARMLGLVLALWLRAMCRVIAWCGSLPIATLDLPRVYTLFVMAVLGALALLLYKKRRLAWFLPAGMVLCAVAITGGVYAGRGVVRVALIGNSASPCAVITRDGQAAVLFRGGASNQQAVDDYLNDHGTPEVAALVDIRRDGRELSFAPAQIIAMDAAPDFCSTVPLLEGVTAELYHTGTANLAVLDVNGYHIGMMAGNINLETPLCLDLFLAGSAYSDSIQAGTILAATDTPRWLGKQKDEKLLYGFDDPVVTLRPGRSVWFEEAKTLAVQ